MTTKTKILDIDNGPLINLSLKHDPIRGFGAGNKGLIQNILANRVSLVCGKLYLKTAIVERYGADADLVNLAKLYDSGIVSRHCNGYLFITPTGKAMLKYILWSNVTI